MKSKEVFTIGYEGSDIDEFILRLKNQKIARLIDIREIPLSRKRGFSKNELKKRVESENIEYVHLRALGSPSEIRQKLKNDHDYNSFFEAFDIYLNENILTLNEAYKLVLDGLNCLMCFERLPEDCHRSRVALKIKEIDGNGLKISHL
jgi:uncharacterized protein (DUF488 family)